MLDRKKIKKSRVTKKSPKNRKKWQQKKKKERFTKECKLYILCIYFLFIIYKCCVVRMVAIVDSNQGFSHFENKGSLYCLGAGMQSVGVKNAPTVVVSGNKKCSFVMGSNKCPLVNGIVITLVSVVNWRYSAPVSVVKMIPLSQ